MILVTTAGKVGTETAMLLASQSRDVRVLVRDADRHTDLNTAGIELVTGDLDDAAAVQAALDGVDSVVLVSPAVPAQELAVVSAAADADVKHIVKVTSKASPDSPVARRRGQSEIEAGLSASGIPHTLLRANAYMQNLLAVGPVVAKTCGFAAATGNGQVGLTDARDVAAVAVHVVGDPAHTGRTYWVTGPQLLSYADVADILSRVLGRTVTFTARTHARTTRILPRSSPPACRST